VRLAQNKITAPLDTKSPPAFALGRLEPLNHVEEGKRRLATRLGGAWYGVDNLFHLPFSRDLDRGGEAQVYLYQLLFFFLVNARKNLLATSALPPSFVWSACDPILAAVSELWRVDV
jgi:hypothetical protein